MRRDCDDAGERERRDLNDAGGIAGACRPFWLTLFRVIASGCKPRGHPCCGRDERAAFFFGLLPARFARGRNDAGGSKDSLHKFSMMQGVRG